MRVVHGVKEVKEAQLIEIGGTNYPPGHPFLMDGVRSVKMEIGMKR